MHRLVWNTYFEIKQKLLNHGVVLSAQRAIEEDKVREVLSLLKPISVQESLIRLGGDGDGGYLVPDDLMGIEYCFSPGVCDYAPFEIDLERRGIKAFLADHSVVEPPKGLRISEFIQKHILAEDGAASITLSNWISRSVGEYEGDLLLQMDIEGSEYEVLLSTDLDTLSRFRIMVIEFHGLHGLFDRAQFTLIKQVFAKLSERFDVVHLHPNNFAPALRIGKIEIPDLMEITFLRKDRNLTLGGPLAYPHPLDRQCSSARSDYPLPECWYWSQSATRIP